MRGRGVHFLPSSQQPCWLDYSIIRLMGLKAACHVGWSSCAVVWRSSQRCVRKRHRRDRGTVSKTNSLEAGCISVFSSCISLPTNLNKQRNACLHSFGDCLVFNRSTFFCTVLSDSPVLKKNVQKKKDFLSDLAGKTNNPWVGHGLVGNGVKTTKRVCLESFTFIV